MSIVRSSSHVIGLLIRAGDEIEDVEACVIELERGGLRNSNETLSSRTATESATGVEEPIIRDEIRWEAPMRSIDKRIRRLEGRLAHCTRSTSGSG
jgi:hypothetical protein